jgi:hypothetical protein
VDFFHLTLSTDKPECPTPRRPQRPAFAFPTPSSSNASRACVTTTTRFIRAQTTDEKGQNCGGPTGAGGRAEARSPFPPVAALVPQCASPVDAGGHIELWVAPPLCQVRPSSPWSLKIGRFRCMIVVFCLQLVPGRDRFTDSSGV